MARRMPSTDMLIMKKMVMDEGDAIKLRCALMRNNFDAANRLLEMNGYRHKKVEGWKAGVVYVVEYFDAFGDPDEETMLSIDGRKWFIGTLARTIHHLSYHG